MTNLAQVTNAAAEVLRVLGPGYSEGVYEEALAHEFRLRGLAFAASEHPVLYKGHEVTAHAFDFTFPDGSVADVSFYRKPEQVGEAVEELGELVRLFGLKRGYAVLLPESDAERVLVRTP